MWRVNSPDARTATPWNPGLSPATSSAALPSRTVTDHPSAGLIRQFYASFDERPFEQTVLPFLHADVVWHVAGSNPLAGTYRGAAAVLANMRAYAAASSGSLRLDTMTVLADDTHVIAVHAASASVGGFAYTAHEVDVFHVSDGLITEMFSFSEDQDATDRVWSGEEVTDGR